MADGIVVPSNVSGTWRFVHGTEQLPGQSRAEYALTGGALVLHALREHAKQPLCPTAARRTECREEHAREL